MIKITFKKPTSIFQNEMQVICLFYLTFKPIKFQGNSIELTFNSQPYYQLIDCMEVKSIEYVNPTDI